MDDGLYAGCCGANGATVDTSDTSALLKPSNLPSLTDEMPPNADTPNDHFFVFFEGVSFCFGEEPRFSDDGVFVSIISIEEENLCVESFKFLWLSNFSCVFSCCSTAGGAGFATTGTKALSEEGL